jgi:hypothetical protein
MKKEKLYAILYKEHFDECELEPPCPSTTVKLNMQNQNVVFLFAVDETEAMKLFLGESEVDEINKYVVAEVVVKNPVEFTSSLRLSKKVL